MTSTAARKSKVKSQRTVFRALTPFLMVGLFTPCCKQQTYQLGHCILIHKLTKLRPL